MRIAVANWSSRKAGGAETYLDLTLPELSRRGHEIALVHELDLPNRDAINLGDRPQAWSKAALGAEAAVAAVRQWRPNVIYTHGLMDPGFEARLLDVAPGVSYVHGYVGTCISGAKTFKRPVIVPCTRRFGWRCIANFYPHRCGGLSPFTMWREYRLQSRRLELLSRYKVIVTASRYMRDEYLRHGFGSETVHFVVPPVVDEATSTSTLADDIAVAMDKQAADGAPINKADGDRAGPCRILFAGRMDQLKGGAVLLDAIPPAMAALGRPIDLTFIGDGPRRPEWESKAHGLQSRVPQISINFAGWCRADRVAALMRAADLLVVPSLWPEPFGRVGPEAGLCSLPAAAFAVGGITDWLSDGINGYLAPGDPPTAAGLAQAIVKCLADPGEHARLRRGAAELAQRFSLDAHIDGLMPLLIEVAGGASRAG